MTEAKSKLLVRYLKLFGDGAPDVHEKRVAAPRGAREMTEAALRESYGDAGLQQAARLDIEQVLFDGADMPVAFAERGALGPKAQSLVREVLDDFMEQTGHYAQISDSAFVLVFPKQNKGVVNLKRSAIAAEVRRRLQPLADDKSPSSHARPLAEIKDLFGAKLAKLSYTIDAAALLHGEGSVERLPRRGHDFVAAVLEEYLAPTDVYARLKKDRYLLVFPRLNRRLGMYKYDMLVREIQNRLRIGASELETGGKESGWADARSNHLQTATPPGKVRAPKATAKPPVRSPEAEQWYGVLTSLSKAYESYRSRLPNLPWDLEVKYAPMWLVQNRLLTSYVCQPRVQISEAEAQVKTVTDERARAATDLPMLSLVADELGKLFGQGLRAVIVLPVHMFTVERSPFREVFFDLLERVPETARRFLAFELRGLPEQMIEGRLYDALGRLRHHGRAVLLQVPPAMTAFNRWQFQNVHAVGISVARSRMSEEALMDLMDKFVETASRKALKTYIQDVPNTSVATAAVCSGFSYISGDAISPPLEKPTGVHEFETDHIYSWLADQGDTTEPDTAPE